MALTHEEIMELMVNILGGNVDEATGWTSEGPLGNRNALLTTERVITRALNDFEQRMFNVLSAVDGFAGRFDAVVGKNYTDDQETFEEIGSNLIIAINDIKNSIANLTEEDIPDIAISKVKNLQNALDGKVDNSRVLTDVPAGAVFTDTVYEHPLNHPISLITDLQGILDSKADNSRILTDVPINAVFTDTVYTHPDTHPVSLIDGLQAILDDKLNNLHDVDPEAHADIRANMVIKDIGTFDNMQMVIEYAVDNQLSDGIYKLVTDLSGRGMPMDVIALVYNIEPPMMGVMIVSPMTVTRFTINTTTGSILQMQNAFGTAPETQTKIIRNYNLPATDWTQGETYYEFEIVIDDMTEDGIADINIKLEDLEKASVIKSANNSVNGAVILYADEVPEGDILCDIKYTIPVIAGPVQGGGRPIQGGPIQ